MDTRFAAGDDDDCWIVASCLVRQFLNFDFVDVCRNMVGMPGASRVTPRAVNGAPEQADEVGRPAHVAAFALPGIKCLVCGEFAHGQYSAVFLLSSMTSRATRNALSPNCFVTMGVTVSNMCFANPSQEQDVTA